MCRACTFSGMASAHEITERLRLAQQGDRAALDEVLAEAGIESRAEGLRRLIQAAGGVFVPDAQMAAEMARRSIRDALARAGG